MTPVLEAEIAAHITKAATRPAIQQGARKITRDLALLDEMEAFFAPLTQNTAPLAEDAVAQSYVSPKGGTQPA